MPSAHRDVLSLARVAARNAQSIIAEIERTDVVMARGYAGLLRGQVDELETWLERLSDAQLLEYCRHSNWSRERQKHPRGRWWCSKTISAAQRELARRGEDPQSWRDGTELE